MITEFCLGSLKGRDSFVELDVVMGNNIRVNIKI